MRIFKVGSSAKTTRQLPTQTTQKMQNLLLKMSSQTEYKQTELSFSTKILSCLQTRLGTLVDSTAIIKPVSEIYNGKVSLEAGKIRLEVNTKTGEILHSKKPFTWTNAYKKVEKLIDTLQSNFDNPEVVEKRYIGLMGVTQKGADKINAAHVALAKKIIG